MKLARNSADSAEQKTRVQLDLAPAQMERLNQLMVICSIETRKDLVNASLSLFEWAVNEVRKGRVIAAFDPEAKHMVELAMPALQDAAKYTERVDA